MRLACWWEDRKHGCFELRSAECGHLDSKFYWRRKSWIWEWEAFIPGNGNSRAQRASFFPAKTRVFDGEESLLPFSKLIFRKRQVFSTHSFNWTDIRNYVTGGKMCPPAVGRIALGTVSWKKGAVLLDFVQITLTPLPLIWTTCTTFF